MQEWTLSLGPKCYRTFTIAVFCCGYVYIWVAQLNSNREAPGALSPHLPNFTHRPRIHARPSGLGEKRVPQKPWLLPPPGAGHDPASGRHCHRNNPSPAAFQLLHHVLVRPLPSSAWGTTSAARRALRPPPSPGQAQQEGKTLICHNKTLKESRTRHYSALTPLRRHASSPPPTARHLLSTKRHTQRKHNAEPRARSRPARSLRPAYAWALGGTALAHWAGFCGREGSLVLEASKESRREFE